MVTKPTKYITNLGIQKSATKLGNIGDTVLSIIDPDINKISILGDEIYYNQSVICLSPNEPIDKGIIFFGMRKRMNTLKYLKNGAAQQSLNRSIFENVTINYHSRIELNEIVNMIININEENIKLYELKDFYLKKFFS